MARTNTLEQTHSGAEKNTQRHTGSVFYGSRDVVIPRIMLILAVFALAVIGLVMVYSSSSIEALNEGSDPASYLTKQFAVAVASVVICAVVARGIPYYQWMGAWLNVLWGISVALLLLTAAIGTVGLGAQRWLVIGPVNFQPSEIAKVAFVLMMARLLYQARTEGMDFGPLALRIGGLVLLPLFMLYAFESDLGTTLICIVGLLAVVWMADAPVRIFVAALVGVIVLAVFAIFFVGYRSDRLAFINPEADYYGTGYQLIRSFYAFGDGGLFGVGLGNSTEKYLYLPEAETDFIFSIIGEELGLIGALVVVALFMVVLYAGLRIARTAPDLFGSMIAGSCTVMLVFQAFLNIGCVLGMLPTTGKPLPFISSGGSSLLGSFLLVGVILSVSFASGDASGIYDRRRSDLAVVRAAGSAPTSSRSAARDTRNRSRNASAPRRSGSAGQSRSRRR